MDYSGVGISDYSITVESFSKPSVYSFMIHEKCNLKGKTTENRFSNIMYISGAIESKNGFRFTIEISDHLFVLDNILLKQKHIIEELAKVTEQLELLISKQGGIIDILNHEEIIIKWHKVKQILNQNYEGEKIKGYVNGLEEKILDKDRLIDDLLQDKMLGLIFNEQFIGSFENGKVIKRAKRIKQLISYAHLDVVEQLIYKELKGSLQLRTSAELNINSKILDKLDTYFDYYGIKKSKLKLKQYEGKHEFVEGTLKKVNLTIELSYGKDYNNMISYNLEKMEQ